MPLAALETRRRLELGDLRRVPRPPRRQPRRQRRLPRRPLRAAPLRDGRGRRSATRRRPSRSTRWCELLHDVDRGRRARVLDHAVVHALRRRRRAGAVALGDATTRCSRCAPRCGEHEGTTLEGIVDGCLDQFSDDEIELLVDDVASRPTGRSTGTCSPSTPRVPERVPRQLEASSRAPRRGGRVVALDHAGARRR